MTNTDFTARCIAGKALEEVAGKQDALTTEQLTAVNSGITSVDVEQIETNKNNISTCKEFTDNATIDSNRKLYISATKPTGDIPQGSTWINGKEIKTYGRTNNLFDKDNSELYFYNTSIGSASKWTVTSTGVVLRIPVLPNTTYTVSLNGEYTQSIWNVELCESDDTPTIDAHVNTSIVTQAKPNDLKTTFTTGASTKYLLYQLSVAYINGGGAANIMFNGGSSALPYEPYIGWA